MDCLDIPTSMRRKIREHSKDEEQQREECIYYWMNVSPDSMIGWEFLGGWLHCFEEEAALRAANEYIQRAPGTCGCGMCMYCSGGSRGVSRGAQEPPLWAAPSTKKYTG